MFIGNNPKDNDDDLFSYNYCNPLLKFEYYVNEPDILPSCGHFLRLSTTSLYSRDNQIICV